MIPSLPIIVAARILLDDALIESREIAHEELPAEPVAEALSEALRNVYVSLASIGDARVFHEAREVAITHVREALARLQTISGEDPVVDSVAQTAARALRLLLQAPLPILNPPPALPRANDPRPRQRRGSRTASVDRTSVTRGDDVGAQKAGLTARAIGVPIHQDAVEDALRHGEVQRSLRLKLLQHGTVERVLPKRALEVGEHGSAQE